MTARDKLAATGRDNAEGMGIGLPTLAVIVCQQYLGIEITPGGRHAAVGAVCHVVREDQGEAVMMTDGRAFQAPIRNRGLARILMSTPRDALKALPAFEARCHLGKLMLLVTQDRAATHLAQDKGAL